LGYCNDIAIIVNLYINPDIFVGVYFFNEEIGAECKKR
jgi:hypothetical protein